eukprot:9796729-Lingulodinium_polyedra.AAC.1
MPGSSRAPPAAARRRSYHAHRAHLYVRPRNQLWAHTSSGMTIVVGVVVVAVVEGVVGVAGVAGVVG